MPSIRMILKTHYWAVILWLISNVVLVCAHTTWLLLPAAALLYGFLPGLLLVRLLFRQDDVVSRWELLILSAAASYGLSSLAMLAAQFVPGPLTLVGALIALDVVFLVLLLLTEVLDARCPVHKAGGISQAKPVSWQDVLSETIPLVVLLGVVIVFRFTSLNYSEYQGDEIDVTGLARLAIAGQDDAYFLHKKGPTELIIATAFALFGRNFDEFALRFPFALASGWAILGVYVLGRRLWGARMGLLAAALLAVNGIFLGFSRMVQYQGVVALMLVSAVICYYLLNQGENSRMETRLGILGLGLWGVGLLGHYEASLIVLVLALLYLDRHPLRHWRWQTIRPLVIGGSIIAIILLAYYIPFMTHEHFSDTFHRYTEIRISPDRIPFNNLGDYLTSSLFYNSVFYEVLMALGLLVAAWVGLRRAFPTSSDDPKGSDGISWLALTIWLCLLAGVLGGAVVPCWLQVAGVHVSLFLALPALAILAFNQRNAIGLRMSFLWFGVYLIAYAFLIRVPGLHYYTLLPAWVLLAAWGLGQLASKLVALSTAWRWAVALTAVVLGALLVYYPYLLFIRTPPEYALSYPQHRNALYWNTSGERPERFFGLPHRSGWKAMGYLFNQGTLIEDYRSNEKEEITTWYTGKAPSRAERPTYYLIADNATAKAHKQDYPAELLASDYREVGAIAVSDERRLHIYRLAPGEGGVGVFDDEELAPLYYGVTGLSLPRMSQP
jgi:4-amino-4-deoxy-L-arabinose transferase-like glycosyltransferase